MRVSRVPSSAPDVRTPSADTAETTAMRMVRRTGGASGSRAWALASHHGVWAKVAKPRAERGRSGGVSEALLTRRVRMPAEEPSRRWPPARRAAGLAPASAGSDPVPLSASVGLLAARCPRAWRPGPAPGERRPQGTPPPATRAPSRSGELAARCPRPGPSLANAQQDAGSRRVPIPAASPIPARQTHA
jgi:hypothetical protein